MSLRRNSLLLLFVVIVGCGPLESDNPVYTNLSDDDKLKFNKYMLLGKEIYENNCASCHQTNGAGLRGIKPPLADADYLRNNQAALPCLLRYGTKDTIQVNGKYYPPEMPPHELSNLELAEVITYINNSWGNAIEFVSVKKVDSLLQNCP